MAADIPAQTIGVRVFSRAKKAGVRTLSKTNPGKPKANHRKALATWAVVSAVKAPR